MLTVRVVMERVARIAAFACLGYALWLSWRGTTTPTDDRELPVPELTDSRAVAAWLADPRTERASLSLSTLPSQEVRALLHAGQQAGVAMAWDVAPQSVAVQPMAMSVEALRDPRGGMVVRAISGAVHATEGELPPTSGTDVANGVAEASEPLEDTTSRVMLRDAVGVLDSATLGAEGAQWVVRGAPRSVSLSAVRDGVGDVVMTARATPASVGAMRRVMVLGAPSWETRFTMRALEEAGWLVDGAIQLSPTAQMVTGAVSDARSYSPTALDTARYAVVVALDSTAWGWGARMAAFVRAGGGAVVMARALDGAPPTFPRVAALGLPLAPIPGALTGARPREGLPLRPLTALAQDAVVLATDARTGSSVPALAARTLGAGRILQAGWGYLWEWRMAGGDDALEEHRAWWREALARVAPRGGAESTSRAGVSRGEEGDAVGMLSANRLPGDAAPYADLVARLGAPAAKHAIDEGTNAVYTATPARTLTPNAASRGVRPPLWLGVIAMILLLGEWWSRRLRGAR